MGQGAGLVTGMRKDTWGLGGGIPWEGGQLAGSCRCRSAAVGRQRELCAVLTAGRGAVRGADRRPRPETVAPGLGSCGSGCWPEAEGLWLFSFHPLRFHGQQSRSVLRHLSRALAALPRCLRLTLCV